MRTQLSVRSMAVKPSKRTWASCLRQTASSASWEPGKGSIAAAMGQSAEVRLQV